MNKTKTNPVFMVDEDDELYFMNNNKKYIEWFNELERFGNSNEYFKFMKSKSFNCCFYNVIHVIRVTEERYKVLILFTKKLWNMYMDNNGIILYIEEIFNLSVINWREMTPPNNCNKYVIKHHELKDQSGFILTCYIATEKYFNLLTDTEVVKRYDYKDIVNI